MIRVIVRQE